MQCVNNCKMSGRMHHARPAYLLSDIIRADQEDLRVNALS